MRMERKWTPAQKSAIDTRDCNVLVSAAALRIQERLLFWLSESFP